MEAAEIEKLMRQLIALRVPADVDALVPPGVYGLFLEKPGTLPGVATDETGLLYIGMTDDEAGERNHFALKTSGFSSPRRSLGALLKDQLGLRATRRSSGASATNWRNYCFADNGEELLTQWMRAHLSMSHIALAGSTAEIESVEQELIAHVKPPLNLRGNPGGSGRDRLEALRKACREEAKGTSRGTK